MPKQRIETYRNGELTMVEEREISAAVHNSPILGRLQELDLKSIRALREGNTERLQELEAQAQSLREQLVQDA